MDKNNTLNFDALTEAKNSNEEITIRLGRLWATASKSFKPVTPIQHEFHEMKLDPYPDKTATMAMAEFMKLVKVYKRSAGPVKFFENQLRDHDITIGLDKIIIEDRPIIPVGGSLVELSNAEITARDCANLITLYTRVKGEEDPVIIEAAEAKNYKAVQMPQLKLTHLRKFLANYQTDVMKARDEMFQKLVDKSNVLGLILVTSQIYNHTSLEPYCKESPALLNKYVDLVAADVKAAVARKKIDKSVTIPTWPILTKAFTLKQGLFNFILISDPKKLWRFFLTSSNVRGGQKKLGALTRGYYRFDISPPLITDIEEVTDVMMIVKKFKFTAVTLDIADVKLALILVYNGVTVYNSALNPKVQPKDKVGVWSRGSMKSFFYRTCAQEPPTLTKHSVTMPDPVPINGDQPTFVVEYIPDAPSGQYVYLPSCRAAQGLCIKTNVPLNKKKNKELVKEELPMELTLESLRKRFCKALWYRNWFLITRYTFVSQDKYAKWFNTMWVYPRLKEDMDEDFFKNGESFTVGDINNLRTCELTITEQNAVPEYADIPEMTEEEVAQAIALLDAYEAEAFDELMQSVSTGTVSTDHPLYGAYNYYAQEEFIALLKAKRDELYEVNSEDYIIPPQEHADVGEDVIEEDVTGDGADVDDDLFGGGEKRTVNTISSDGTVKQEKD